MKYRFLAVMMAAFLMLPALGTTAFAFTDEETTEDTSVSAVDETNAFTPDGIGTIVDNATDAEGKEFYTITTPSENVFYLIIDRQRETDNVYFLNAVTEADLMALAEITEDGGESISAITDNAGTIEPDTTATPEPELEPEPEAEPESSSPVTLIIAVTVVLLAGGAGYYFKVYRPKQQSAAEDEYEPESEYGGNSGNWADADDDGPPWYDDDADGDEDDSPPWDEDDTWEDDAE